MTPTFGFMQITAPFPRGTEALSKRKNTRVNSGSELTRVFLFSEDLVFNHAMLYFE